MQADRSSYSEHNKDRLSDQAMNVRGMRVRSSLSALLLLAISLAAPKAAMASPKPVLTFAAYGDIPYLIKLPDGRRDDEVLTKEIAPALRQRDDIPFIIHLGDLSRPEYACSDEWLQQTNNFWKQKLVKPVFYTPGDNDWADCDRKNLPVRQSELQRLQRLREILFSSPKTVSPTWQLEETQRILNKDPQLSQPEKSLDEIRRVLAMGPEQFAKEWRYESQAKQPENAIWWRDGVLFVTVHRISTDDGRSEILLDDPRKAIALVNQRDRLNQQWLDRAFKIAAKDDTKALVVATQLDPFTPAGKNETPSPIALPIRHTPASANKSKACPRALANRCYSCTETPTPIAWTSPSATPKTSGISMHQAISRWWTPPSSRWFQMIPTSPSR